MVDTAGLWQRMGSPPIEDPQIHHPDRFAVMPRGTAPEIVPSIRPQLLEGDREHQEYHAEGFVDHLSAAHVKGHNSVYKTAGDAPIPPRADNNNKTTDNSVRLRIVGTMGVIFGLLACKAML